ncbi:Sodium/hydrogen exchanger family-domain-containing protein [Amylocystis lapponica]|nr:Sodium/hydrogen exchanger family-domain-containing protein [Amylocystis lapponica]
MSFHPFQVSIPHIVYAVLGAFVVFFGMFSLFIREKLYIGEACWAFLFGIIIGPYGANIFNPRGWGGGNEDTTNTITLEFTRVVLAIGVFAIGVELPKAYMARHWKSLFFLLFPVMTWGWFVAAGLIYALIPGLNFLSSLAVAACLTPTDPILAAAVVGGKYADKHVPAHLRHLLAAESGCNDGAAFPFLFIALYLITDSTTGKAVENWFLLLWLYQVILGIVFGAVIGFGFRHLMKFCERKDLIDRQSYVAQYVSLAMFTIGVNTLLGSDDLLAAFSCGTAFAWDGFFNRQTEESVFSSVIDLLFNVAAFVFVGAWMPFSDFTDAELTLSVWRLLVIAILVLLLRRLPIMIILYRWIPDVKTFREAVFSGHFGPMGVGAVFISTLAAGMLPEPASPPENQAQFVAATIQPIVAFMVLCSITVHGLSIPFFSLGRRVHSVSRTWSRHDTFGTFNGRPSALPEWTTHTRRVMPGEDIVINRDSEMERGTLSAVPIVEKPEDSSSQDEKGEGSSSQAQDEEATRTDGSDMRSEPVPDGKETETEWREGPHRIIERRAGPGEEVEVEVQRDAYSEEEGTVDRYRVAADYAEDAVQDIKNMVGRAPHEIGQLVERADENLHDDLHEVEDKAEEVGRQAKHAVGLQDDEEEGWMSDGSNGESHDASGGGSRRSKSPKQRSPKPHPLSPAGPARKRLSIRRGLLGGRPPRTILRTQSEDGMNRRHDGENSSDEAITEAQDDTRGRGAAPIESAVPSSIRSPRHARIHSLRSSPREQSPARSVRWADTAHSGANTPRVLSPSSPSTPMPGSEAPSDDEQPQDALESPRNQVRFHLPNLADRRA